MPYNKRPRVDADEAAASEQKKQKLVDAPVMEPNINNTVNSEGKNQLEQTLVDATVQTNKTTLNNEDEDQNMHEDEMFESKTHKSQHRSLQRTPRVRSLSALFSQLTVENKSSEESEIKKVNKK